jgi:hypothetical protein
VAVSSILALKDFVKPSELVQLYKGSPESLTISFGSLIESKLFNKSLSVPREVSDPIGLLASTEYHEPLVQALKEVFSGFTQFGCKVLSLIDEMGFGKTHFLVLLWQLFTEAAAQWDNISKKPELSEEVKFITEAGYKLRTAQDTLVIPVDMISLIGKEDPYKEFFNIVARACEYKGFREAAGQLSFKDDPHVLAEQIATIAFENRLNILILLDELYAAICRCVESDIAQKISSLKKIIMVLTHLTDIVAAKSPTVIVYASAQQDVSKWNKISDELERGSSDKEVHHEKQAFIRAVKEFEARSRRKAVIGVSATKPVHAIRICSRKLLKFEVDRKTALEHVIKQLEQPLKSLIKDEGEIQSYLRMLRETFPFAPEFALFAEKLMQPTEGGDLPRSQHIRDLLKISSLLIDRLEKDGFWSQLVLISPSFITHDMIKHLLPPNLSQDWSRVLEFGKRSIDEEEDDNVRLPLSIMHTSLYLRGLTANGMRIIDMIRRPDALALEELRIRSATLTDLTASVIGVVNQDVLTKVPEAISVFSTNKIPFVLSIERGEVEYFVLTIVPNAVQFIESFKQEELSKIKASDGTLDIGKAFYYLQEHFSKEGFVSELTNKVSEQGLNPIILDASTFLENRETEEFISTLKDEVFNLAIVNPISLVNLRKETRENLDVLIKGKVKENYKRIRSPNMFAIVCPKLTESDLMELCAYIAEVNAAQKVVEYYKGEGEEGRVKRKKLAEKMPTYNTIKSFLKETTIEDFEEIIDEVMNYLQTRIESYATKLAANKLNSYTISLCRVFSQCIYYDSKIGDLITQRLEIKLEGNDIKGLRDVYSHLPSWISRSVKHTCCIVEGQELRAHLLNYLANEAKKKKEKLLNGEQVEIDFAFIVNALKKGWADIPVKPISIEQVKSSLKTLNGMPLSTEDPQLKDLLVETGKDKLIIKMHKTIIVEAPPPQPKGIIGLRIRGVDNVIIGLELIKEEVVKSISLSFNISEANVSFSGLSCEDVREMFGDIDTLVNMIGRLRNKMSSIELTLNLANSMEEKVVEGVCKRHGLRIHEGIRER